MSNEVISPPKEKEQSALFKQRSIWMTAAIAALVINLFIVSLGEEILSGCLNFLLLLSLTSLTVWIYRKFQLPPNFELLTTVIAGGAILILMLLIIFQILAAGYLINNPQEFTPPLQTTTNG